MECVPYLGVCCVLFCNSNIEITWSTIIFLDIHNMSHNMSLWVQYLKSKLKRAPDWELGHGFLFLLWLNTFKKLCCLKIIFCICVLFKKMTSLYIQHTAYTSVMPSPWKISKTDCLKERVSKWSYDTIFEALVRSNIARSHKHTLSTTSCLPRFSTCDLSCTLLKKRVSAARPYSFSGIPCANLFYGLLPWRKPNQV